MKRFLRIAGLLAAALFSIVLCFDLRPSYVKGALQAGDAPLATRPAGCVLYGSDNGGRLFTVNVSTGGGTLVGMLPVSQPTEIEYDPKTGRAIVQDGGFTNIGREFDIYTADPIGPEIFEDRNFVGFEWVGPVLYGTSMDTVGGPSSLRTLDPWTGVSTLIGVTGVGPIAGLAYDANGGIMYGVTAGSGPKNLVSINLTTGSATVIGPLGMTAGGLELGSDGILYAGSARTNPGRLYRIDPATGVATLIGPVGFPDDITGLASVCDLAGTPKPTPSPSATPTPTPSPTSTPTPTPTPTQTPTPTPTPCCELTASVGTQCDFQFNTSGATYGIYFGELVRNSCGTPLTVPVTFYLEASSDGTDFDTITQTGVQSYVFDPGQSTLSSVFENVALPDEYQVYRVRMQVENCNTHSFYSLEMPVCRPASSPTPTPQPSPGCPATVYRNFHNPVPVEPADRATNEPGSEPGLPFLYPSTLQSVGSFGAGTESSAMIGLTVTFTVNSARPDDLDILLASPISSSILISDAGGNGPVANLTFTLKDLAPVFPDERTPSAGAYGPANYPGDPVIEPDQQDNFPGVNGLANYPVRQLSTLTNGNPNALWRLYVADDENGNLSSLPNGWSMETAVLYTTPGGCLILPTPSAIPTPTPTPTPSPSPTPLGRTLFDFDGDSKADVSVFRPSVGEWYYQRSSDGDVTGFGFGSSTDRPVPADFTGDGKTDIAFFRPSTGDWYVVRSEDSTYYAFPFGGSGDIPAPSDFDGDGEADPTVYRPSAQTWFILKSTGGVTSVPFGLPNDVPVPADYDGDGLTDVGIYRPAVGQWWHLRSSDGSVFAASFGNSTDKPVPGDYTGDGHADVAFFRPSEGNWYVLRSEDQSFFAFPFGNSTDKPAPADFDGDGRFDSAVFRPSDTNWYILKSTGGVTIQQFGAANDVPLPGYLVP